MLKVPKSRSFYYRTYEDSRWRMVMLDELYFSQGGASKPSPAGFGAVDVTDELKVPAPPVNI